jgi:hypothetical protein
LILPKKPELTHDPGKTCQKLVNFFFNFVSHFDLFLKK